jgi:LuxR family maltose regulon positive regulatory protein
LSVLAKRVTMCVMMAGKASLDGALQTKLYMPRRRPGLVERPRLLERLADGLRQGHKLILISAPAGFGKTTLLSEWIGDLRSVPGDTQIENRIAWLSLDEDDNDTARFFTHLIATLEMAQAGMCTETSALLQSLQPPSPKAILTALINDLATLSFGVVLVLDDYHAIEQIAIHTALTFLLDHMPSALHLVIASRTDPPLHLARLRTRSQLTELRAADLRFTPQEAATFLDQTMGLQLSTQAVEALEARTEGWIAGLQLAALSMRGKSAEGVADFIAAFGGSHRHVIDYLAEEVLAQQSDEVQSFLCQTAILDRLTAPLCDAVRGQADSQAILEQLEQTNLFLVALDDERKWYRYHLLFADFLRSRLRGDARLPELHRRAAEWHQRNGSLAEAIQHLLDAADFEAAASLIEQVTRATLMRSEIVTFLNWVEALPHSVICAHPTLHAYNAWALLLTGHSLDEVEARLQDREEDSDHLPGEAIALKAFIAAFQGRARLADQLSQQALERLPEDDLFVRGIVALNAGIASMLHGDLQAGSLALDHVAQIGQAAGNAMITVVALCNQAEVAIMQGHLRKAPALYQQAQEWSIDGQGRPLPIAGMALIGLGELAREKNELESAASHVCEGIELIKKWGEIGAMDGYIALARIKQAQGDNAGANEAIEAAKHLSLRFDTTQIDDIFVAAYQARLWVAQGKLDLAWSWAKERELKSAKEVEGDADGILYLREIEQLTLARVLLGRGEPSQVMELLEGMQPGSEQQGAIRNLIEIHMLKALALRAQGHTSQAFAALKHALTLAEPEGFVRLFVDEGEPMRFLISDFRLRISERHHHEPTEASRSLLAYADRLLAVFGASGAPSQSKIDTLRVKSLMVEPLSKREMEVLRLIAAGLSNSEIAARLVVAPSTIKTHINNLYGKLGVSRRTQALARAQELGLLGYSDSP